MNNYIVYCDGSYMDSIKAGGWASIILDENENLLHVLYQGMTHTTNNRMELRAVIETLKYFKESSNITIYSDSQYVVNGIQKGWAKDWLNENDLTKKNLDLWFELLELLPNHTITINWVKGHANNKWNELADHWCTFAAQCYNLPRDIWTINSMSKN